jgi:hypothetical protein
MDSDSENSTYHPAFVVYTIYSRSILYKYNIDDDEGGDDDEAAVDDDVLQAT